MKCHFNHNSPFKPAGSRGFSLAETAAALVILSFFATGILVVVNRCVAGTADSAIRRHAFHLVRNNMEKLLASGSVRTMAESGFSETHPEVEWKTTVETFYEPVGGRMWIRAICSAQYPDTAGEKQTIELTHWLTNLTQSQLSMILQEKQRLKEQARRQLIDTLDRAAEYAETDEATILEWIDNGMQLTEDDLFIKGQLDLYRRTRGDPSPDEKKSQAEIDALMGIKTEDNEAFYDDYRSVEAGDKQPPDKLKESEDDLTPEKENEQEHPPDKKTTPEDEVDFRNMTMEEIMDYINEKLKGNN